MADIGSFVVPAMILGIMIHALCHRVDVYSAFTSGLKDGVQSVFAIFPALFALFIAIGALRASGLVELVVAWISPLADFVHFPSELVPFALLRPVSGSGSLAFASDIFANYGPDSFAGRAVSVMMGSTETTFYTTAVYFAATGTKDIRHTLKCALIADCVSMAVSVAVCRFYY